MLRPLLLISLLRSGAAMRVTALQRPPQALLVLRDGDDAGVGAALAARIGPNLQTCLGCETALSLLSSDTAVYMTVFELRADAGSIELAVRVVASGGCLFRYQIAADAFKRVAGRAGPSWVSAAPSEEAVAEANGLGFIGDDRYGEDEQQVVDVAKLSDEQVSSRTAGRALSGAEGGREPHGW